MKTTEALPASPRRHIGLASLALAVMAVVAVVIVWRYRGGDFNWSLFWGTLTSVDRRWLAASIALMLLTYFGCALRWEAMLPSVPSRFNGG